MKKADMHIDVTLAFSQFIGSLPVFVAVILAWLQTNTRISDLRADFTEIRADLKHIVQALNELDKRVSIIEGRLER